MMNKINILIGILIIIILVLIGIIVIADTSRQNIDTYNTPIEEMQKEKIKYYKEEIATRSYTLESPWIKVNPYGINPLSAYVAIDVEEPMSYSYKVEGTTENTSFDYTDDTLQEEHVVIPVIMLYEGKNTVDVTLTTASGETQTTKLEITTSEVQGVEEIPEENIEIKQEGILDDSFIIDGYFNIYDEEGKLRYLIDGSTSIGVTNEKFFDSYILIDDLVHQYLYKANLMGEIQTSYKIPYDDYTLTYHHDSVFDTKGNLYILGGGSRTTNKQAIVETQIYKYGSDGKLIDTWDYYDQFKMNKVNQSTTQRSPDIDPIHLNSIEYNEERNELILSSQAQSAIYGVDADTGEVTWISSYEGMLQNEDLIAKQLTPIGDDFINHSGQHTVFIDHNPKYDEYREQGDLVVSLYNNNFCRAEDGSIPYKDIAPDSENGQTLEEYTFGINTSDANELEVEGSKCVESTSEVLFYAINFDNMTIETINHFDVKDYSAVVSSVFPYKGGYSVNSGNAVPVSKIYAYDPEGTLLLEITPPQAFNYRARVIEETELEKSL